MKIWRRSYDIPPPALEPNDPRHPSRDPRYVDLGPGDSIVFCTDGVTEAGGSDGYYGIERCVSG